MSSKKSPSTVVIGLALFSMFFGSGNLIFPLMLGVKYQGYFYIAALGFIITAVILPTLGILAMIPACGRYENLFSNLLNDKLSKIFFFLILVFWIPFGSGPRCVLLAHASLNTFMSSPPPVWLFSLFFLSAVYFSVKNKGKLIDFLGKVLTPLLLVSIFFIVVSCLISGDFDKPDVILIDVFIDGVTEGYYTQDLIAAIFFSSALVGVLSEHFETKRQVMKKTLKGGMIAVALLAVLYSSLMAASAVHGEYLGGVSGEKLVSALAQISLGNAFGGISSLAVSLACFTTEIALVLVFANFLNENLLKGQDEKWGIFITLSAIFLMSLLPFEGIMAVVAPAMQVIYPVLFLLVIRYLWRSRKDFLV